MFKLELGYGIISPYGMGSYKYCPDYTDDFCDLIYDFEEDLSD